jgi:Domain of unknown function (DUF4386)
MGEENLMNRTGMARVGSFCSIIAGIVFLASGVVFFAQMGHFNWNSIASISEYLRAFPQASTLWTLANWGAAIASFLAIAGVLALSDEIRLHSEGVVRWTSTLAIIGYSILAITNVADVYQIRRMAEGYFLLDPSAQSALEVMGSGTLDPTLSLRYITIGPWFLAAGLIFLRNHKLPKVLSYLGMVGGIAAFLFVVVSFLELQVLTLITGALAVVFQPVWYIWTGIELGRPG